MKITILNDNYAGNGCGAEHGLSYLIENKIKILLDTGPSDIIIRNAAILGIDLNSIGTIVLSHGHFDHGGGLPFLQGQKLVCHPGVFDGHYSKIGNRDIGLPLNYDKAKLKFDIRLSKEPLWITEQIVFLGEIPRINDFESKTTPFVDEDGNDDFIIDDSGIAIITQKGLVVVSGCAHAGICNIVDHAVKVTGEKRIELVVGGFHLKKTDELTFKTIRHLKNLNVKKVLPSHCTEFPALKEFVKEWDFSPLKSGDVISLE